MSAFTSTILTRWLAPSWQLARTTLGGKPGRSLLMIGAVSISAALVVAVSCAVGSVQASMEMGLVKILGASDARIIHQFNSRFDDDLLATVRQWPEVARATGRLAGTLTLVHADGRRDAETDELLRATPIALGVDFSLEGQFRESQFIEGAPPTSPNDVVIDPICAEEMKAGPGDLLEVQRFGDPIQLRVAGIYQRQRLGAVQRPLIELDRETLALASDHAGELTSIVIILKDGYDVQRFCDRHLAELPEVLTLEPAEKVKTGFDRQITASRFGLIVATVLTFMCAAFIIVTALTTSVSQRQREMAVTRCVGASRPQLFASQIMVGLLLAVAGAATGVPLGIGLAALLVLVFRDMMPAGLDIQPLGIGLAILGSAAAGVAGAIYPAWMASHVSPLQAMSFQARAPQRASLVLALALGLAFVAVQLALMLPASAETRFYAYAYAGLPSVHIGYFILAIPILIVVTVLVAPSLSRVLQLPAGMLGRSVLATPFRHGFTAGALMVGVAILVSTWSSANSLLNDWIGKIRFADGFAFRTTGISPQQQSAIARLPFVEAVCPIGYLPLRVFDRQIFGVQGLAPPNVTCVGFDPDVFFRINAVEWTAGDPPTAIRELKRGRGLIVADRFLVTQKVKLGDTLTLGEGRVRKDFKVVGAVNSAGLDIATHLFGIRSQYLDYSISCVFMDWDTVVETFDNRDAYMMQVNLAPGVSDEEATARIAAAAPGVQFRSGRWILKTVNEIAFALLTVQSTVAFAALVLASIGVGNVILANIQGRRFEYGVLRAVGAPRRMLMKLIAAEAALLALTGAITGTLLGIHLAWVGGFHYRDLAGLPVRLNLPELPTAAGWVTLLLLTLIATVPGLISIIRPKPSMLLAGGRNG